MSPPTRSSCVSGRRRWYAPSVARSRWIPWSPPEGAVMREAALSEETLAALRRYDSPAVSNAIETFDVRPRDEGYANMDVRCMFPDLGVMVGYAATATIRA